MAHEADEGRAQDDVGRGGGAQQSVEGGEALGRSGPPRRTSRPGLPAHDLFTQPIPRTNYLYGLTSGTGHTQGKVKDAVATGTGREVRQPAPLSAGSPVAVAFFFFFLLLLA